MTINDRANAAKSDFGIVVKWGAHEWCAILSTAIAIFGTAASSIGWAVNKAIQIDQRLCSIHARAEAIVEKLDSERAKIRDLETRLSRLEREPK